MMRLKGIDPRWGSWIALGLWTILALPVVADEDKEPELDVPYVPTHPAAVEEMLKLAKVTGKDYVMDLGCGDGRIVVAAATRYKARGMGVDLDPKRVRESKENAKKAGVTGLVTFKVADVMHTDVRQATVITLFLLESLNVRLRPRLFAQLKPGVRVVSNSFHMRDWKPDRVRRHSKAYEEALYFWVMPAPVGGTWKWKTKLAKKEIANSLKLEQEFQVVRGAVSFPEAGKASIAEASLAGKALSFTAAVRMGKEKVVIAYRGTADGDVLKGTQEWRSGPHKGTYPWVAKRTPVKLTGRWRVRAPSHAGCNGTLHIQRKAGGLSASYVRDKDPKKKMPLPDFYVWGSSIRFEVSSGDLSLAFSGSLRPGGGGGTVAPEQSTRRTAWFAKRLAGPPTTAPGAPVKRPPARPRP